MNCVLLTLAHKASKEQHSEPTSLFAGKWKGVTVAVKIVEHTSEANGGIRQLRESILSSSIIHPNVVRDDSPCQNPHVTEHSLL